MKIDLNLRPQNLNYEMNYQLTSEYEKLICNFQQLHLIKYNLITVFFHLTITNQTWVQDIKRKNIIWLFFKIISHNVKRCCPFKHEK